MSISLFFQILLFASSPVLEMTEWVRNQFQINASPEIQAYYGQLSDDIPFVLVIGSDEHEIIGTYKFQHDKDQYYLYGENEGEKMSLVESTKEDLSTGYLFVTLTGNTLEGYWTNYNTQSKLPIVATRIDNRSSWIWPKSHDWAKQFYGQYSGRNIELLIQKEQDVITGTMFSADKDKSFFLNGKCTNDSCTTLEVTVIDEAEQSIGIMTGQFFQENVIFINFRPKDSPSAFYSLPIRRSIELMSKPKLSFHTIQDFTYPQLEGFRDLIDQFYQARVKSYKFENDEDSPPDRLKTIQNGWMDIHWMNNRVITASLIYHDNILNSPETELVNYDIKKNEVIAMDELFKKKSKYNQIISRLIKDRLKQDGNPYQKSEKDFKHVGLVKNGLLVTTDFDIWGGTS